MALLISREVASVLTFPLVAQMGKLRPRDEQGLGQARRTGLTWSMQLVTDCHPAW